MKTATQIKKANCSLPSHRTFGVAGLATTLIFTPLTAHAILMACAPAPEVPGGLIPFLGAALTGGLVLWRGRKKANASQQQKPKADESTSDAP